jgi:Ca-activated chloride channel family protein
MPQNVNNSAVGAEASVSAKAAYKKSFSIRFTDDLSKSEQRQITMAFKAVYTKLVQKTLEKNEKLRISFDKTGTLIGVEILEDGKWVLSKNLTKEFLEFVTTSLKLNHNRSFIIEK